jgi:hypothetical protein
MPLQLNIQSDFAAILDGGEPITLLRKDSAATVAVAKAWRFSSHTSEAEPAGGHVAQTDVIWQFAWDEANGPPRLGDAIVDGAGECHTILAVDGLGAKTRIRCATRNLRLVYELTDRVTIERAVREDGEGGPEVVGWETLRALVPARIQPLRLEVDDPASPAAATATFRIILGERLDLPPDTRFVDSQGNIYALVEFTQAERIDALPAAVAVKQPAGP